MIFVTILLALASVQAKVTVLLDSTEESSSDWLFYSSTLQPPSISGWKQGENNSTSFEVCDNNSSAVVSNWLWTPFIERGRAMEINIEIDHHIKTCVILGHAYMPFCKEEFALFLHQSDNSTIQHQLQSWDYAELEEIGRFYQWDTERYYNTKRFGVNKTGFYLAINDQGSCLSIKSIKVFYKACPEATIDFVHLPETLINRNRDIIEAEGECVANAVPLDGDKAQPKRRCEEKWPHDWEWSRWGGTEVCRCKAGYQPDPIRNNTCIVCPIGKFKPLPGGEECTQCPPYTIGLLPGLEECPCMEGYHRSSYDSAYKMCSRPPSSPTNLTLTKVHSTNANLSWKPPLDEGNRTDTRYRVSCDTCGSWVAFNPDTKTFSNRQTSVTIENLYPETSYRFLVFSQNGVSYLSEKEPEYAEIIVVTTESNPVNWMT